MNVPLMLKKEEAVQDLATEMKWAARNEEVRQQKETEVIDFLYM